MSPNLLIWIYKEKNKSKCKSLAWCLIESNCLYSALNAIYLTLPVSWKIIFMKKTDIDKFIESNSTESINLYFSELLTKSKAIDKENNKIVFFLLLLIFIYYLTDFAVIESINLGFLLIKNVESVKVFIPLIFSFIIFRFAIINTHKAEIKKIVRKIAYKHFNFDNQSLDIVYTDDFSRTVLPISVYDELNKFNFKTNVGCLNSIIMIPLVAFPALVISASPFVIEWFWLKPMIIDFNNIELIQKGVVVLTIWIIILSFVYYIKTLALAVTEDKIA